MNKIKNPPFFFLFAWWSTVVYSTSWSYTTHIDLKLLLLLLLLLQQTALVCKEGRRVSFGNRIASSTWRKRWKKKKVFSSSSICKETTKFILTITFIFLKVCVELFLGFSTTRRLYWSLFLFFLSFHSLNTRHSPTARRKKREK